MFFLATFRKSTNWSYHSDVGGMFLTAASSWCVYLEQFPFLRYPNGSVLGMGAWIHHNLVAASCNSVGDKDEVGIVPSSPPTAIEGAVLYIYWTTAISLLCHDVSTSVAYWGLHGSTTSRLAKWKWRSVRANKNGGDNTFWHALVLILSRFQVCAGVQFLILHQLDLFIRWL